MKKILNKIIFSVFFIMTFFTPIIFVDFTAELFEFPKMFFMYFFGTLLIFIFLLKIVINEEKIIFPSKIFLIFLFIFFISTIFSGNIYTSVWGYYSRFNDGFASILLYIGIYFVGINTLDSKKIEVLKNTLILGSIPVCAQGIMQIGIVNRVYSTIGQPNWLAAYILMILFFIIRKIIILYKDNQKILSLFLTIYLVLLLIVFIFTKSLSGFFGLGLVLVYCLFVLQRKLSKQKTFFISLLFILLIITGAVFLRERVYDALNFSTDPATYKISDPGIIRSGLWKGSVLMWLSSPKVFFIGTGPETFTYNFPFFRQDILNYSSEWDFIMNKPHNYYLEILTETGILLFIFYLIIIFKIYRSSDIFIKFSIMGFLISNFFGWPTVATSYLFWLYMIFIYFSKNQSKL